MSKQSKTKLPPGLSVFPIPHGTKAPRCRWSKVGSSDPEQIAKWAAEGNLGIATGERSGIVVIDVDDKNGKSGSDTLAALVAEHGPLPPTYTVATPTGGYHLYFRRPETDEWRFGNGKAGCLGEGLDVRGDGGMVVAPGSETRAAMGTPERPLVDGQYVVARDLPFADLPEWIATTIRTPPRMREGNADAAPSVEQVRRVCRDMPNPPDLDLMGWRERGGMILNACGGDPAWREIFYEWSLKHASHCDGRFEDACAGLETSPLSDVGWEALQQRAGVFDGPRQISDKLAARLARMDVEPAPETGARPAPVRPPEGGLPDGVEWISDASLAPLAWRVDGVLEAKGLSVLYGDSGSGKSFVAVDMGLSVARGLPFAGQETRQGAVMYIAGEGVQGIARRAHAWARQKGVDLNAPIGGAKATPFFRRKQLNLLDKAELADLVEQMAGIAEAIETPFAMVIIDTLARNFHGNENATDEMQAFVNNCDTLKDIFGCSVLIVHHTAKGAPGVSRGSGALRASADTEMRVTNEAGVLSVRCTKQKEADEFGALNFVFREVALDAEETDFGAALECVPWDMALAETFADKEGRDILPLVRVALGYEAGDAVPREELVDGLDKAEAAALLRWARDKKVLTRAGRNMYRRGRNFGLFGTVHNLLTGEEHTAAERVMSLLTVPARAALTRLATKEEEDNDFDD